MPEVGRRDTSLRYTDILFGFVLRELFVRLQDWPALDSLVRLHLIAGTVLVLGSWIGYRRSLKRAYYEVKFFNLPLWMFVIDQVMLVLYFRIAVLTDDPLNRTQDLTPLAVDTIGLTIYVFVLYLIWDALGLWMAVSTVENEQGRRPRYPAVDPETDRPTGKPSPPDWFGIASTACGLGALTVLWLIARFLKPDLMLISAIAVLIGYRWAKEIRTSWNARTLEPAAGSASR